MRSKLNFLLLREIDGSFHVDVTCGRFEGMLCTDLHALVISGPRMLMVMGDLNERENVECS